MKFKTQSAQRLEQEWNDPKLKATVKSILDDAAQYGRTKWNWDFVITSIHRTLAEDAALHASGIHVEWRAVDIRTPNRRRRLTTLPINVNDRYVYDPARPALRSVSKNRATTPFTRITKFTRIPNKCNKHEFDSAQARFPHPHLTNEMSFAKLTVLLISRVNLSG